ncbi:MAG: serine hydrolase domain-containing protein, partial [Candidatus Hodarchaeales archaeon]
DFQTYIQEIPGVALGIFLEDEIVFKKEYGYANLESKEKLTDEHLFRIASHSKLFTATAIMKLYHDEKLSLDDKVSKYLLWFTSDKDINLEQIRIRHLLTHSSGITRDGETGHWIKMKFPNLEEIMEQVKDGLSFYQTSEHLKYSNFGYTILGQIVEVVSGQSYEEYVQTTILDPLSMKNTFIDLSDVNMGRHAIGYKRKFPKQKREHAGHVSAKVMNSATGFSSNVEDLIKFYKAHIFGNEVLFPDYIKREMQRVQFKSKLFNWGLGFSISEVDKKTLVGHGGGYPGYITFSGMNQDQKMIIVLLTSATDGPARVIALGILNLLSKLLSKQDKIKPKEGEEKRDFSDIIGFYNSDWATSLYSQVGNKLVYINPELDNPVELFQIFEFKENKSFLIPPDIPLGSPGQIIKFFEDTDGEMAFILGGAVTERFKFSY